MKNRHYKKNNFFPHFSPHLLHAIFNWKNFKFFLYLKVFESVYIDFLTCLHYKKCSLIFKHGKKWNEEKFLQIFCVEIFLKINTYLYLKISKYKNKSKFFLYRKN